MLFVMLQLSFWIEPSVVGKPVDIMVSPTLEKVVLQKLKRGGIFPQIMINDVQELIDEEEKSLNQSNFNYNEYNTYETVSKFLKLYNGKLWWTDGTKAKPVELD